MSTIANIGSRLDELRRLDRERSLLFLMDNLIWPILLVALLFFSALLPEVFTQFRNIRFLLFVSAGLGAITLAEALCLISGNFDLSVGSIAGFSAMFTALFLSNWFPAVPGVVGILIILAVGGSIGLFNGIFIAKVGVNPFLQTLASLIMFEGGILVLSTVSVFELPESYLWIGGAEIPLPATSATLPVAIFVMFGLVVAVWVLMTQTRFGRAVYAVGGDEQSAAEAGIDTERIIISVFVLSGMLSATGGLLLTGFNGGATPTLGTQQLFPAFTAAVIGGISLFGGRGNVINTLGGVLLLGSISAGLVQLNISPQIVQAINGLVLFAAIVLYTFIERYRERILSDL